MATKFADVVRKFTTAQQLTPQWVGVSVPASGFTNRQPLGVSNKVGTKAAPRYYTPRNDAAYNRSMESAGFVPTPHNGNNNTLANNANNSSQRPTASGTGLNPYSDRNFQRSMGDNYQPGGDASKSLANRDRYKQLYQNYDPVEARRRSMTNSQFENLKQSNLQKASAERARKQSLYNPASQTNQPSISQKQPTYRQPTPWSQIKARNDALHERQQTYKQYSPSLTGRKSGNLPTVLPRPGRLATPMPAAKGKRGGGHMKTPLQQDYENYSNQFGGDHELTKRSKLNDGLKNWMKANVPGYTDPEEQADEREREKAKRDREREENIQKAKDAQARAVADTVAKYNDRTYTPDQLAALERQKLHTPTASPLKDNQTTKGDKTYFTPNYKSNPDPTFTESEEYRALSPANKAGMSITGQYFDYVLNRAWYVDTKYFICFSFWSPNNFREVVFKDYVKTGALPKYQNARDYGEGTPLAMQYLLNGWVERTGYTITTTNSPVVAIDTLKVWIEPRTNYYDIPWYQLVPRNNIPNALPGFDTVWLKPGSPPLRVRTRPKTGADPAGSPDWIPDKMWEMPTTPTFSTPTIPATPGISTPNLPITTPTNKLPEPFNPSVPVPSNAVPFNWNNFTDYIPYVPSFDVPRAPGRLDDYPTEENTRFDDNKLRPPNGCKPGEDCLTCKFNPGIVEAIVASNQAMATEPDLQSIKQDTQTIKDRIGESSDGKTLFQTIKSGYQKMARSFYVQALLSVLNFLTVLHNAIMLSRGLFVTLTELTSQAFTIVGRFTGIVGWEDTVDLSTILNEAVEDTIKGIVGEDNWAGIKTSWAKYNRIYQVGSHINWTMRSIFGSTKESIEWINDQIAKIGNGLRKRRVVAENEYEPMVPFKMQGKVAGIVQKASEGIENMEEAASGLSMVTSEVISIQDEAAELKKASTDFKAAIEELTQDKKAKDTTAKIASTNPTIAPADLPKASTP